jgi:hypothetical protein
MFGQFADPPLPGACEPAGAEPGLPAGGEVGGDVGDDCAHATAAPPTKNPAITAAPAIACLSRRFMLSFLPAGNGGAAKAFAAVVRAS